MNVVKTNYIGRLNPTNVEIEKIKIEVDEDGSGEIEFEEFLKIMNSTMLR